MTPKKAIGYCRVSVGQAESSASLEAQEASIREEADRRGWDLVEIRSEVASGKNMKQRPELLRTLNELKSGTVDTLIVARLDRLSRSVIDFAGMMETAQRQGWSLSVLDLGVDTTTTNGKLISHIMIALAQWERELIGDRTKIALEAVRARGTRLGRPPGVSDDALRMIRLLREAGQSWQKIADTLTAEEIPTGQGGKWHAATTRKLYLQSQLPMAG